MLGPQNGALIHDIICGVSQIVKISIGVKTAMGAIFKKILLDKRGINLMKKKINKPPISN